MRTIFALLALTLLCQSAAPNEQQRNNSKPTFQQCVSLAQKVDDSDWLKSQSLSAVDDADSQLGMCEGYYAPLKKTGIILILSAHGSAADESRNRVLKALEKLPPEVQLQVLRALHPEP